MVLQKQTISVEGAYQEAIEDAASRIFAASRPTQPHNDDIYTSSDDEVLLYAIRSLGGNGDLNSSSSSLSLDRSGNNSDTSSALDGDNSTDSSTTQDYSTDDDAIKSNIMFLEKKQRILKNALILKQKEEAYVALNAHDIANGRDPSISHKTGNPSIWSEAKAVIEEHKLMGGGGGGSEEEEEGCAPDASDPSAVSGASRNNYSSPSLSTSPSSSPSSLYKIVASASQTPTKRPKIDLSMVERISAGKFAEEHDAAMEVSNYDASMMDDGEEMSSASAEYLNRFKMSPTTRCQQASEMVYATDSRHWISQAVLNQILTLTNAAVT